MKYEIDMDGTEYTVIAACPCGWRVFKFLRSDAWHAAATHMKIEHGDLYAARRAADAEYRSLRRERAEAAKVALISKDRKRPNTKSHGTSGHTRAAGKRAASDSGAQ